MLVSILGEVRPAEGGVVLLSKDRFPLPNDFGTTDIPETGFLEPLELQFLTSWSNQAVGPESNLPRIVRYEYDVKGQGFPNAVFPKSEPAFVIPPGGVLDPKAFNPRLDAQVLNGAIGPGSFGEEANFVMANPKFTANVLSPPPARPNWPAILFEWQRQPPTLVVGTRASPISTDDAVVGAQIDIPPMVLVEELQPGLFRFENISAERLQIRWDPEVFLTAALNGFLFDEALNQFYYLLEETRLSGVDALSPFFDPALPDAGSEIIGLFASALDPSSPSFDPALGLFISISPTQSSSSGAMIPETLLSGAYTGYIGLVKIPEPPNLVLFALGILAVVRLSRYVVPRQPKTGNW